VIFIDGAEAVVFFCICAAMCVVAVSLFRSLDRRGFLSDEADALHRLQSINHPTVRALLDSQGDKDS
jgi:hypothetical protein